MKSHLLTMLEFSHHAIIIPLCDAFRITDSTFDESLKTALKELVHFIVIVVVVPDAEHTLYVVPDCSSETWRVHFVVRAHRIVGQVVSRFEFVVEKIAHVVVQPVH